MKPTEWLRHTPALLLATLILIALTSLHSYLDPTIQQAREHATYQVAATLLEGLQYDNDPFKDRQSITKNEQRIFLYPAKYKGQLVATAIAPIQSEGYNGPIQFAAALRKEGSLAALLPLKHQETPGIGAKMLQPDPLSQFLGLKTLGLKTKETQVHNPAKLDALSGATITTNAITQSIQKALTIYTQELKNATRRGESPPLASDQENK